MQTSMQRKLDKNDDGVLWPSLSQQHSFQIEIVFRNIFRLLRQRQVDAKVNFGSFFV